MPMPAPEVSRANAHLRYLVALFATALLAAAPPVLLNYRMGDVGWANAGVAQAASTWQEQNPQGIVAIAPGQEHNLKFLTLNRQIPNIDTVILGSSTSLSIVPDQLAPLGTAYNLATRGSSGWRTIAEADYFADTAPSVKWLIVSLDRIADRSPPVPAGIEMRLKTVSFAQRLRDAVSLARLKTLGEAAVGWARSPDPVGAIMTALNPSPSETYRCEGLLTRNFAVPVGTCGGYRWDGSIVSVGFPPETPDEYRQTIAQIRATPYFHSLSIDPALPNTVSLEHLARTAARLRSRGGGMIGLIPPMLPGLESGAMHDDAVSAVLRRSKIMLDEWARLNGIVVIDAAASERFGCTFDEFHDEIHSFVSCDEKVFSRFWRDRPSPGLYTASIEAGRSAAVNQPALR